MAIRPAFLLAGSLLALTATSTASSAGAEPLPIPLGALDDAAVPPLPDELAETEGLEGPAGSLEPELPDLGLAGLEDPWAEAVAEALAVKAPAFTVTVNPEVTAFVERFTGPQRTIIGAWLNRSVRYLDMIRDVFRSHGLPEDLAFVAMIESGFNPAAVSRAGAKGLWQFMAATARRYGLRVDRWVDERFDPEKSTLAAARYLRDLHAQFGSWALAKAAYNAGEAKIGRAISTAGSSDFWALRRTRLLRQETRDFVPAIQAAILIGRDPARFGFTVDDPGTTQDTATIHVPPRTNLKTLAAAARIPYERLEDLNRVLVRGITPPGAPYELRVPAEAREPVRQALLRRTRLAKGQRRPTVDAAGIEVHIVRPGETVVSIARQHGLRVTDVLRWNSLDKRGLIRPGDRLRLSETRLAAEPGGRPEVR